MFSFPGLSFDDDDDYENALEWACRNINLKLEELQEELVNHPSIILESSRRFLILSIREIFIFQVNLQKEKIRLRLMV
jgi:L-ribulose-5-phosphate 3-epimerase UlaE